MTEDDFNRWWPQCPNRASEPDHVREFARAAFNLGRGDVSCRWCQQTSCYCCPECGRDVRDEHAFDCFLNPENKFKAIAPPSNIPNDVRAQIIVDLGAQAYGIKLDNTQRAWLEQAIWTHLDEAQRQVKP